MPFQYAGAPISPAPLAVLVQTALHTYTITSNGTLVSVDTTNLQTSAFLVPASGKVICTLSASVFPNSATTAGLWWAVRIGGIDSQAINVIGSINTANLVWLPLCTSVHYLTGLTPGASVVATWRACIDAASSINMFSGSAISVGSPGPATMVVHPA